MAIFAELFRAICNRKAAQQECVDKLKDGRLKLSESLFSPVPHSAF